MANDDLSSSAVEERPTSYNSKGQAAMMVGIGVLLVILIIYSVTNSKGERETQSDDIALQTAAEAGNPLSSTERFDKEVEDQRKQLQRGQFRATEDIKKHIDQRNADLMQQNNFLIDQLTQQSKTPLQSWEESAVVRVRESRYVGFGFQYFEEGGDGQGGAMREASAVTDTDRFLQQETARLAQLQTQLNSDISDSDFWRSCKAAL